MSIIIDNLHFAYRDKVIFDGFSTVFDSGITCLIGRSGSGKTTLLRLIMRLEKPQSGKITGNDSIAAVFQEDRLCEQLNAVDNIRLVLREKADVSAHLAEVMLSDGDIAKPVSELSGGMKRRVALVRAVASNRNTLLLDEPFKGLDENTKSAVIAYLLRHIEGKTAVVVTHDPEDIILLGAKSLSLSDRQTNGEISSHHFPVNTAEIQKI